MKKEIKKINEKSLKIGDEILELKNPIAGTDYYICKKETGELIIIENNYNKEIENLEILGGFHYGLIPENFKARNNIDKKHAKKIRGINSYSIWTKTHRPTCKPNGMTYNPKLKIWLDIYMCNSNHKQVGTSAPNQNFLAGGNSHGRVNPHGKDDFLYKDFEEVAKEHDKRFITFDEFISSMRGVKEFSSAKDEDNGITKHNPDFVSMYGIEQATGHNWIWSEKIDHEKAVGLGGDRDGASCSGSRASLWSNYVWDSSWRIGVRFACDSLKLDEKSESDFSKQKNK